MTSFKSLSSTKRILAYLAICVVLLTAGAGIGIGIYLAARPRGTQVETDCGITTTTPATTTQMPSPEVRDPSVIIIGGGLAGLGAALNLSRQNVNVTIVEAGPEMGGRIKSTIFHGYTVELGPHWIQKFPESPLWQYVEKLNVSGIHDDYENYTFRNATGHIATEEADEIYEIFENVTEDLQQASIRLRRSGGLDANLRSTLKYHNWQPVTPLEKAIEYFEYDWEEAVRPEILSLWFHHYPNPSYTGEHLINDQRGLKVIVDDMVKEISSYSSSSIMLNQSITNIAYNSTKCKVTSDSGSTLVGDFCLVTVSLGVLQSEIIQFSPPLPDWKRTAILKHGFGNYANIYLKFPDNETRFWDDTLYFIYASPSPGHHVVWVNYEHEGMLPTGANIILATALETELDRINPLTPEEIKADLMGVLRKMYGDDIPDAEDILMSDYHENKRFLGSYAHLPVGFTEADFMNFKLHVQRLYFAGDAYTERYIGYTHGAFISGQETAEDILRCIKGFCNT